MTAAEHKAPRADRRRIVRLTDLLAVVVLIAILSTLLGPQFSIASSTPLQNALRHELDRLSKQVALYRLQHDNQSPGMTADGLSASKFVEDLTRDDFVRILTEPQNALTKQQVALMATENVFLDITEDAIEALADIAYRVNQSTDNIGARRLTTVMEKLMEDVSFSADERPGETIRIDAPYVKDRLANISQDSDLSRFIL